MPKEKREGWISKAKAKKRVIVRDDKKVHTFVTGGQAQATGHGLAIIPNGAKTQNDILFVETKLLKKKKKKDK